MPELKLLFLCAAGLLICVLHWLHIAERRWKAHVIFMQSCLINTEDLLIVVFLSVDAHPTTRLARNNSRRWSKQHWLEQITATYYANTMGLQKKRILLLKRWMYDQTWQPRKSFHVLSHKTWTNHDSEWFISHDLAANTRKGFFHPHWCSTPKWLPEPRRRTWSFFLKACCRHKLKKKLSTLDTYVNCVVFCVLYEWLEIWSLCSSMSLNTSI